MFSKILKESFQDLKVLSSSRPEIPAVMRLLTRLSTKPNKQKLLWTGLRSTAGHDAAEQPHIICLPSDLIKRPDWVGVMLLHTSAAADLAGGHITAARLD